jgi:hypothetical protein
MKDRVGRYCLSAPAPTERRAPNRWLWFIALSTAGFLLLAGIIAVWFPSYDPIARALVLFSVVHAVFLLVQKGDRAPDVSSEPDVPDDVG